jgi:adenylate cyclase
MTTTRRLAAILAADIVGYSRQIAADEAGALARLRNLRTEVIDPLTAEHDGRLFKTMGDGFLVEFASAVQALRCAVAIQSHIAERDAPTQLRIGLHQGDVVVDGDDLLGDGVNIATRLEALAEPGGICISGRMREDATGKMTLNVDDLGTPTLKNIDQPIQVFRIRFDAPARPTLALPDKPSLAVLPFTNLSGDPEQEYFADGVVEDIITSLSRTGWLLVIARNSSFTYKGRAHDIKKVGREMSVRYVLEGSIRRAGGRVRITGQLIDAATGGHVWADRFEGELADIFELQDRITESVVGAIEPSLRRAEIVRATVKPTEKLDAYDLYLRALPRFYAMTDSDHRAAVTLLRQALALDPSYVRAKGLLAFVHGMRVNMAWAAPEERTEAVALAREVVAAGTDDPDALRCAGITLSFCAGDYHAAFAALNRALALHPNSAQVLNCLAFVHNHTDDPETAIGFFERAMRLSPLDPEIGYMLTGIGVAHGLARRPEQALPFLQRAVEEMPNYSVGHVFLIGTLVGLGRLEEARAAAVRFLAIRPDWRAGMGWGAGARLVGYRREVIQALVTAGIPE